MLVALQRASTLCRKSPCSLSRPNHKLASANSKAASHARKLAPVRSTWLSLSSRSYAVDVSDEAYNDNDILQMQYFSRQPRVIDTRPKTSKRAASKAPAPRKPTLTETPPPSPVVAKPKNEVVDKKIHADSEGRRLDRYIHELYPGLPNSRINKLLRDKKIVVKHPGPISPKAGADGFLKVEGGERLQVGSIVRIKGQLDRHEGKDEHGEDGKKRNLLSAEQTALVQSWVLHKDDAIIILNKPSNWAVQGGTGIRQSIDDVLGALSYEKATTPKLVHRLDQGASGLLVLARDRKVAQALTKDFASHNVNKLYWAICGGTPKRLAGTIKVGLRKQRLSGDDSERVYVVEQSDAQGVSHSPFENGNGDDVKPSHSKYHTIAHTRNAISMLALRPRTGRTHQLRVHCAQVLGAPILGDYKYGPGCPVQLRDFLDLPVSGDGLNLHLHSREIAFNHPLTGKPMHFVAPPPDHMQSTMKQLDYQLLLESSPYSTLSAEERQMKPYEFKFTEGTLSQKLRVNKLSKSEDYQKEIRRKHAIREKLAAAPKALRSRLAKQKSEGKLRISSFKQTPFNKSASSAKRSGAKPRRQ